MSEIEVRDTIASDKAYLELWLKEPGVLRWFPMCNSLEITDAVNSWMSYMQQKAVLTALCNNKPSGMGLLYVHSFERLRHQCLFAIIVPKEQRKKGIGTFLLEKMIDLAKDYHKIELLHLEVYDGNPAISLYERFGFEKFGYQKNFIKEDGEYLGKIMMQKKL